MNSIWILRIITFLASFLLFQIQFIIGKIFLSNFGGGYMVWGACMVFFQGALLIGYLYAHKILEKVRLCKYLVPHAFLLMMPFVFFPGRLLGMRHPSYGLPMVFDVFTRLLITIGPAFFALSTMSIICQAWLALSTLPEKDNPYALFSVSNLGSLLALLSYPFIFEMFFDLNQQQHIWRILYVLMVLVYLIGVKKVLTQKTIVETEKDNEKILCSKRSIAQWFFYSAAGVAFFLAVTNVVTAEIAPMPFLWMIPLALYLLSYVLNFKERPWSPILIEKGLSFSVAFCILLYFFTVRQNMPTMLSMVLMLIFVFFICMFCQKRLYALRPQSDVLTFFYFIVSLGGFVGGITVTWIIPLIFVNHAEYFLGLVLLLIAWALEGPKMRKNYIAFFLIPVSVVVIYLGPMILSRWTVWGFAGLVFLIFGVFYYLKKERGALLVSVILIFILIDMIQPQWYRQQYLYGKRNYYGINKVFEVPKLRLLIQGTTIHGAQYLDPQKSFIPLTYYGPKSPAAQLLINEDHYQRIGMVGLGTGALAMYPKQDQVVDFYELDKDILFIAQTFFSYLDQSRAKIHFIIQDARIGLEQNKDKRYEILIIDAFSSDSVPVHLLTVECLELYRKRLTPDGVVLFHLSNRYANLMRAFLKTVSATQAYVLHNRDETATNEFFRSDWMAITYDQQVFHRLIEQYGWTESRKEADLSLRPWTDAYSNLAPYFLHVNVFSSLFGDWNIK